VLARQEREASHQQLASNAELGHTNEELLVHNETLDGTNQHLIRTNVDLNAFVYTASHDLQGPLTNLNGLLQALREELPASERSAPVAHILNSLYESVERFQHTLTNLGALARAQTAAGQPAPPVPIAYVVRDVLLDLALPIAEAGAQLTMDVADCPTITCSEKNLRSVVYNLLSNAVKYRHPNRVPHVRVACRTEAHFWVLEVQDNRLGLALPPGRPSFGLFKRFHTHVDGSDEMTVYNTVSQDSLSNKFKCWSPRKDSAPQEHKLVEAVLGLCQRKFTAPQQQAYVESLEQYYNFGLPCRVTSTEPFEVRLCGSLSSDEEQDLTRFVRALPTANPILIDVTNFEGMGTIYFPLFRRLLVQNTRIVWVASEWSSKLLREMGVPASRITRTTAAGRALILKLVNSGRPAF
jgi:hypothetical protein